MTTERLEHLIKALKKELNHIAQDDPKLLDLADQLDADIEKYIASTDLPQDDLQDTLLTIEAQLSAKHPVITKITEDIIVILGNMGI